jgi:hypothetical protein
VRRAGLAVAVVDIAAVMMISMMIGNVGLGCDSLRSSAPECGVPCLYLVRIKYQMGCPSYQDPDSARALAAAASFFPQPKIRRT